jgi:hypothetical protein
MMIRNQITIPKPCHENWNEMHPAEKGRFCDRCTKIVFDFTKMKQDEIDKYLLAHKNEKLCGRFMKEQVKSSISIQIPVNLINLNKFQSFLLSLLLVFGTTLFSCTSHDNNIVGKLVVHTNIIPDIKIDSVDSVDSIDSIASADSLRHYLQGEVLIDFGHEHNIVNSNKDLIPTEEIDSLVDDFPVMGKIKRIVVSDIPKNCTSSLNVSQHDSSKAINSNDLIIDSKEVLPVKLENSFSVFPNPAHEFLKIKMQLDSPADAKIRLFDLNGKLIRVLSTRALIKGDNELQMDISGIISGEYIIEIESDESFSSQRVIIL